MRNNIVNLLNSPVTGAEISRHTGITRAKITRLRNGEINIDNISLITAEKLNEFYVNKEEIWMDKGHGTVTYEKVTYALEQEPYITGTHESPYYEALATDNGGREYMVRWEIVNPESEDESDACDWDSPAEISSL